MARGMPAVWSAVLGAPLIAGGAYGYVGDVNVPKEVGIPMAVFGAFIIIVGTYIHVVAAPSSPNMRDGEEVVDTRNPASRAAIAKFSIGFLLLVAAVYLFYFTYQPYVYPTVSLAIGLYLFSTGIHAYWTNTLTTYYVTNRRLIKEYRFISLVRQEVPFDKVRGVEERKTVWEALVGLGNLRVASGGGGTLEIVIRNIYYPTKFADKIRDLL